MSQQQLWNAGHVRVKRRAGRPITKCRCGSCDTCKHRDYMRTLMRDRAAGITRPRKAAKAVAAKKRQWTPEEDARIGTLSDYRLAKEIKRKPETVTARRLELGIPKYRKPTGTQTKEGYRVVNLEKTDPMRAMTGHKNGRIFEHRLVMARHLGRLLSQDEVVHHKNGNRSDNRIDNLELWTMSHPPGQNVDDKVAWAKELLARYGHA